MQVFNFKLRIMLKWKKEKCGLYNMGQKMDLNKQLFAPVKVE